MKFVRLHPKEVKYCSTLDWDELMIYLKTKYGITFQKQFEKQLSEKLTQHYDAKTSLDEDIREKLK